jgi:hypothetical protein
MGYVYFICEKNLRLFKIGRTVKHPKGRLRELQTGNPRQLRVYGWISTEEHVALELWFHRRFSKQRCFGEWFKVSARDLYRAVDDVYAEFNIADVNLPTRSCCLFCW